MKRVWFMAWLAAAAALGNLRAEEGGLRPSGPELRRNVISVIDAQLSAFRIHDVNKAYGLAAAALRQQFTLVRFAQTVKQGYPEIWTNARAEYGIVEDNGVRALIQVRVFQGDGASASYDYVLFKEPAGWRIGSVTLHPPPPRSGAGTA